MKTLLSTALMTAVVASPAWAQINAGELKPEANLPFTKTPVANVPTVFYERQLGMQGVFLSPHYATDHNIYLTYAEPGEGGSSLALARAQLSIGADAASLEGFEV